MQAPPCMDSTSPVDNDSAQAPTMDNTSPSDIQVHSKEHPFQMENSVTALFTVAERFIMLVVSWCMVSRVSAFQFLLQLPPVII